MVQVRTQADKHILVVDSHKVLLQGWSRLSSPWCKPAQRTNVGAEVSHHAHLGGHRRCRAPPGTERNSLVKGLRCGHLCSGWKSSSLQPKAYLHKRRTCLRDTPGLLAMRMRMLRVLHVCQVMVLACLMTSD